MSAVQEFIDELGGEQLDSLLFRGNPNDWPNRHVTVNAVCPGWVDTELVAGQIKMRANQDGLSLDKARTLLVTEKQPMAKMTPPESLAELVLFLCSDHGSTLTGAILPVDGGWTAQ